MSATIELAGQRATVTDGRWVCGDAVIARTLNLHLRTLPYQGYDLNPDLTAAKAAAEAFGGRLIHYDEVEAEEGVVY